MYHQLERFKNSNIVADKHFKKLRKIALDLSYIPVPDQETVKQSPFNILPSLGSNLIQALDHYGMDMSDPQGITQYSWLLDLRFWRVANLIQILLQVLPTILPLYENESSLYNNQYNRLFKPSFHSHWNDIFEQKYKQEKMNHNKVGELIAKQVIVETIQELQMIYDDFDAVIDESTWDL
ncbi:MAG: hypothetical protein PWQ55_517 [Chloroflexota bacterium]|nr:hypothetical protein [Chloroflexota bacterium]